MSTFLSRLGYLGLSSKAAFKKAIEFGDLKKVRALLYGGLDANINLVDDDTYHFSDSPLTRALMTTDNAKDMDEFRHTKKAESYYKIIQLLIKHDATLSQNTNMRCIIKIDSHTSRHYITMMRDAGGTYGFSVDEKISQKVSKLLVNNFDVKCNYTFAAPEQAIADIYLPSALKYMVLFNPSANSVSKVLPDAITTEFFPHELKPEIMEKFNVTKETADNIIKLLVAKIQKLTPDEIATETEFLKSLPITLPIVPPSNIKLIDTVFASITSPIRTADALADDVRGAKIKAAFIKDHAAIVTTQQFESFTVDKRVKINEWAKQIAARFENKKELSETDLKLIFTVIINLATNNKDAAAIATRSATNTDLAKVLNDIITPRRRSIFRI